MTALDRAARDPRIPTSQIRAMVTQMMTGPMNHEDQKLAEMISQAAKDKLEGVTK